MGPLRIICFLACMFMARPLSGWWDAGHMVIAQIAYEELTPETRQKVHEYLKVVSADFPHHNDFILCSTWADDISNEGIRAFFVWHGSARPFSPDGTLSPQAEEKLVKDFVGNDIVWAIEQCCLTLKNPAASPWAKGFMLRMLVHIVGDIHQPLHCITLYSKDFPRGDQAGLRYAIQHPNGSLHSLFDAGFGSFDWRPDHVSRSLAPDEILRIAKYSNDAISSFPRMACDRLLREHDTPDSWRQESYDIGRDFAYAKCLFGKKIPEEVMREGLLICEERVALAGYRLADLLNGILGRHQ